MKFFQIFLLMLPALCSQVIAEANNGGKKGPTDSTIQGSVLDMNTRKPLSDVIVSLTSKQQKKKELRSDASGSFYFPQLMPGEFVLQLEKKGYKTSRKDVVMMKEGMQLTLALEALEEESEIDSWNPLRVIYGK